MNTNKTAAPPPQEQALVTATEWFAGGQRIWYDPESARVLTEEQAAAAPGALRVFERVAAAGHVADAVWLTLLPGFPDGSYGWAQVDAMRGEHLGPRLYVEPVGQGDSDKPRRYRYSTVATDMVQARTGATVAFYVGGSEQDPYEHRQITAARQRVPQAEILTFPGGHLTTSEHPDLLAAAIRGIADRHGVGTPTTTHQ
jgi:pimeloyl-ACP methyl ester carboxylesterase